MGITYSGVNRLDCSTMQRRSSLQAILALIGHRRLVRTFCVVS